jgi:nucleolar protein 4
VVEQPDRDENQEVGKEGEKKKKKFTGRGTRVKQAKIVRQQERIDPVTGNGKSKGYGFIEMNTHGDALRVLRWANNNSDIGPLLEEWWKEELGDLIKLEKGKEARDDARLPIRICQQSLEFNDEVLVSDLVRSMALCFTSFH